MAGDVKPGTALLDIIRAAVVNTAARPPGRRGPFVFDEAELQRLAAALTRSQP